MEKNLFDELVFPIKEAGAISRGKMQSSNRFKLDKYMSENATSPIYIEKAISEK